jgi:hypothetical protein
MDDTVLPSSGWDWTDRIEYCTLNLSHWPRRAVADYPMFLCRAWNFFHTLVEEEFDHQYDDSRLATNS